MLQVFGVVVADAGVRRITNRCSGPWTHKVLARGRAQVVGHGSALARTTGRFAAAELSR